MARKKNQIESEFGGVDNTVQSVNTILTGRIDFSSATKLKGGGSTCDIYRTRIGSRLVFIKRLKEEYIGNPLYMSAFRKEYEVATSLSHRCLPWYYDCTDEYITMNYVDGQTIAEMVKKKDRWLTDKDNVKKILRDLLDVISYLHDRNVIHCDIKADNIMLTYGSHNLYLIDLDKCYTSWFDNTAGASENYELPEESRKSPLMDFRGIGKILDTLSKRLPEFPVESFIKFREECKSRIVTVDKLLKLLDAEPTLQIKEISQPVQTKESKPKRNYLRSIKENIYDSGRRIKEKMDRKNITEMIEDIFKMTGIVFIIGCILGLIFGTCSGPEEKKSNQQVETVEIIENPDKIIK